MSASLQQLAEKNAGRKPDGDPVAMERNADRLLAYAGELDQQADRMGKTHMALEGLVIERANERAGERKKHLQRRAGQLRDLAASLKDWANKERTALHEWNARYDRELQRLKGGG